MASMSTTNCSIGPVASSPALPHNTSAPPPALRLPLQLCAQLELRSHGVARSAGFVQARLGRTGGAGVLERPGLDQSQNSDEPRVEEGGEMGKISQRRKYGGGDRYRVLLLDHERHTEPQVASVLPKVVPSLTADEARKCFQSSREKGVGIVTVTVKEHAEFYAQMMARSGLRSGIEPDSDII